jgi:hypothetical protein
MNSEKPGQRNREAGGAYSYSTADKLRLFLPCLRQKLLPHRNLFAGPFAGEFGWELMQWQGFVRSRRSVYRDVHVLTYPGRDYLYEGCHVHYHNIELKKAGYGYGLLSPEESRRLAAAKASEIGLTDYDVFDPPLLCTRYHKAIWTQDFRLFQEPSVASQPYDVIFHFRSVKKVGPDQNKNYPVALADELISRCLVANLNVACLGHPEYAYCPRHCIDHRTVDLRQTVAAISSARVVAGENSGPMHLANLCGKPTVIWAQDQWRIDYSLRWNPFRVPIYVVVNDTFEPRPAAVADKISDCLRDLARRSDDFTQPLFRMPAQSIPGY